MTDYGKVRDPFELGKPNKKKRMPCIPFNIIYSYYCNLQTYGKRSLPAAILRTAECVYSAERRKNRVVRKKLDKRELPSTQRKGLRRTDSKRPVGITH